MTYIYSVHSQQQDLFWWDISHLMGERFHHNELVRLEAQIDRDVYHDLLSSWYTYTWRGSIPVRIMLWLELLKHMWTWISDEKLLEALQTDLKVMRFCGIKNIYANNNIPRSSSSLTHFRNKISGIEWLIEMIQEVHLKEVIKTVPKKRRLQYDQDSTVIEESIKYPHDIDLLSDLVVKSWTFLKKCKSKAGDVFAWWVAKWSRMAKKLNLTYHFANKKKDLIKPTKKKLLAIGKKAMKLTDSMIQELWRLDDSWRKDVRKLLQWLENYSLVAKKVIQQQEEMLIQNVKKVADRIVSLHKSHVRPMVKWGRTKFWWKVQVWMIWRKLSVIAGFSWDNVHDGKTVKDWVDCFERVAGKPPWEFWTDKWYRDKEWESYRYLKEKWIKNCIQWTEEWNSLKKKEKKRLYARRAFTEPMINDLKNHRGCNRNKYKKENTKIRLIFASIAWNYKRVYT